MSKWVDCTQPVGEGMPKMPFLPEPRVEQLHTLTAHTPKISQVQFCTHLGTHVDAPSHFIEGGKNIDQYPVDRFVLQGVIWPVTVDEISPITREHLKGLTVRTGEAVFLASGWGDHYMHPRYYEHPYLDDDAAAWLVEQGVSLVGMDFLTPDRPPKLRPQGFTFPAHRTLLGNDVLIIENLTGLKQFGSRRVEIVAPPLYILGGVEAAPARVLVRTL